MKLPIKHRISHITAVIDLDGTAAESLAGEPVIHQATRLAAQTDGSLSILAFQSAPSVMSNLQTLFTSDSKSADPQSVRTRLFGMARELQHKNAISVQCELIEDRFSAGAVVDRIDRLPTDLLVMDKPEHLNAARAVFDGLSDLIRHTGIPVWFAESGNEPSEGIVAAIAGTPDADRAANPELDHEVAQTAHDLGHLFDADMHLVQAARHSTPAGSLALGGLTMTEPARAQDELVTALRGAQRVRLKEQEAALEAFAEQAGVADSVDQTIVAEGSAARVVTQSAEVLDAGLIVMGAEDKSRWDTLLKGGTAESMLAMAPCDVLYVKNSDPDHLMPKLLMTRGALIAEELPEEVDVLVNPRKHFASPTDVSEADTLSQRSKQLILEAWEEELANEANNEMSMPQQVYDNGFDEKELDQVRATLRQLRNPTAQAAA